MAGRFIVNFKKDRWQKIDRGSIVTYVDEFRLKTIKEHLTLKTDFFIVESCDDYNVDISNGVDTIKSTYEQLLKVNSYLEEIPEIKKPIVGDDPNTYLRELITWGAEEELLASYKLRDNFISIISSGLIITDKDFLLEYEVINNEYGRREVFASLIPDKISTYL